MTVEENNFLISKFDGYNYPNINSKIWKLNHWEIHNYHEDWNLLMRIVEKIENCSVKIKEDIGVHRESVKEVELSFTVDISGNQCTISKYPSPQYYGSEDDFLKLYDCRNENKKQSIFKAVTEFIKWYYDTN